MSWTWLGSLLDNLGMAFPDIVLLGVILSTIIFYAHDIRYGLLLQFILFGFLIVWLDSINVDLTKTLIAFFVVLVIMTLSSLISGAKQGVYQT